MTQTKWIRIDNVPTLQGYVFVVEGSAEQAEYEALAGKPAKAPVVEEVTEDVVEDAVETKPAPRTRKK